jgi:hypothetical protein
VMAPPSTIPSTTTSTSSNTYAGSAEAPIATEAPVAKNAEDASAVDAGKAAPLPIRRVDSKPACGPGEVVSMGHCCPGGHVWQSGRCERPLATSF